MPIIIFLYSIILGSVCAIMFLTLVGHFYWTLVVIFGVIFLSVGLISYIAVVYSYDRTSPWLVQFYIYLGGGVISIALCFSFYYVYLSLMLGFFDILGLVAYSGLYPIGFGLYFGGIEKQKKIKE